MDEKTRARIDELVADAPPLSPEKLAELGKVLNDPEPFENLPRSDRII